MNMTRNFVCLGILFVTLFSCKKEELKVISGNDPAADPTVSTVIKENYIQRLYITLLGRKADSTEFYQSLFQLNKSPNSEINRKVVIEDIMKDSAYFHRLWDETRNDFLDGVDTTDVNNELADQQDRLDNATNPNSIAYYTDQVKRLEKLVTIVDELQNGSINMQEVHKRTVNNRIYDEINMGTENFVVSTFQNFLFRYPTSSELEQASDMVDNRQAVVFLQNGQGKDDFIKIFFEYSSYFEGQVIYFFQKYLFRSPSTQELNDYTLEYISHKDYKTFQIDLLASEEFYVR